MAFTDDFSGESSVVDLASHTPSGGTAWTRTGTADSIVVNNALDEVRASGGTTAYYICDDQGSANHYAQVRLKNLTVNQGDGHLACRLVDSDNFISWRLQGAGSSGARLAKVVTGTVTDLVTFQGVDESVYKVECSGTDIKIYEDGVQKGTTQTVSDHQTETSQGFVSRGNSNTNSWLDDFEAGALGGGALTGIRNPMGGPIVLRNPLGRM